MVETFTNTANAAAVLGNQTYGPYGNQRYAQGAMGTAKGFTGQYADTSGLDYDNARYYDPVVGQFTAPDTVQGNLQGADPYTYVAGNPETNTDPTGNRIDWGGGEQSIVNWNTHTAITTESQTSTWSQVVDSWSGGNYRTTCTYGCGGTRPWYDSPSSAYITHYVNTHHTVRHAAAPVTHTTPSQPKHKSNATSNPVVDGLMNVGKGLMWAGDQFLGVSSMVNDVHTLSGNGSWQDKAIAAGDLGMNAFMDISMVFGVGEELRGGELLAKGGFELAEEGGEHLAEACGLSFSYATTVAVEGGSQSIGSLKVGQKVWAYNTQTKKMELEPIQHVIVTTDNDLVDLTISTQAPAKKLNSETIHTNKKHPFLVAGKGFIPVGKLRLGMPIVEANGQLGIVAGWKSVPGSQVMYNLTVTQDHTYAVGTNQWIVHNEGSEPCTVLANDIYRAGQNGLDLTLNSREVKDGMVTSGISHFEKPVERLKGDFYKLPAGTEAPEGLQWVSKYSKTFKAVHVGLEPIGEEMSQEAYEAAVETLRPSYINIGRS
ncbi:RHS repeat-associated core domain-containing protein [Dictyobacter kobayashii]|uniref:Intein C-terminal splicing domain-containing protein n=1 Tax=Dictyobacter kobayashii TaxID=2014872 RepID=A0A402AEY9_9CHLR|nr:RHS repeat-associated core domain-containing protein [Dictyobacter kobayashii]GCE17678.1 hypothetical protein KDK_14780 [Dictyobacter kobayashii]